MPETRFRDLVVAAAALAVAGCTFGKIEGDCATKRTVTVVTETMCGVDGTQWIIRSPLVIPSE